MGVQIAIQYRNLPVTYDVTIQEGKVYQLRLCSGNHDANGEYIPEKIVIRRKGKIWISDMDNYDELITCLTKEIIQFDPEINESTQTMPNE
jgi:hypothetical protein